MAVAGLFFEPGRQRGARNAEDAGNAAHAGAFPIGGENTLFFRGGVAVFGIEHGRFSAVFAAKLLAAILIMAIFDKIGTATAPTSVNDFIDDHTRIIIKIIRSIPLPKDKRKRSGGAAEWTAHQMINDVLMAHLQK